MAAVDKAVKAAEQLYHDGGTGDKKNVWLLQLGLVKFQITEDDTEGCWRLLYMK